MAKRTPLEKVREAFASVGLKLLSTDYVNNSALLFYRCLTCGYEGKTSLTVLVRESRRA